MRKLLAALAIALGVTLPLGSRAQAPSRAQAIADAVTELDVERAKTLLEKTDSASPTIAFERARLAIYLGDCDTAAAILSSAELTATPEGAGLLELSKSCARATAGALVHDDRDAGVLIRLQDEADRALVPFIVDVAVRARKQIETDLGTQLPRPLRMDLVRDLFTLSAISGLPVTAAETTGTVAVARWGRVTMISPRATHLGYPWEDTLAHEIAHLALSRATRDRAPLWLQEGIAKREETRWREPRPLDGTPSADVVARTALASGRSVGVDKLGPSIAMLPTPDAAATAFSEVTSFVAYWIRENGVSALHLFFTDLKGSGTEDASVVLRSVTGYDLAGWISRWQRWLLEQPASPPSPSRAASATRGDDPARRVRLGDLLFSRGHSAAAVRELSAASQALETEPSLRFRWARALCDAGRVPEAREALGGQKDVRSVHGGWQALSGRFRTQAGDSPGADTAFRLGIAVDPLSEEVACEGQWRPRRPGVEVPALPADPRRRDLCESARLLPLD
ncbi:MAG: hypothetical protein HYZ29_01925 [Myxococcales bacterium]|nr:hypothetical protein [Myxococcales bacterium]